MEKNTTCLLDCHHTGTSRPQRSTLLPTISADRHFGKCVHQFLEETISQSKRQGCERERKKVKQEASKVKRYYQGGWALKSYGISSGTASYDMNSYSGFTDGLGEPLETPGKFSCLCLFGRGLVGFYHILNPKPIME